MPWIVSTAFLESGKTSTHKKPLRVGSWFGIGENLHVVPTSNTDLRCDLQKLCFFLSSLNSGNVVSSTAQP